MTRFQYASILLASWLVCTRLRLFSILPSISAKSLRSRAERHDRMTCSLRSRRGINFSYSALPFRVMRRTNSRRSSSFSTRSTSCRFISAVTARLMVDLWVRVQCAIYCALHAPFRNIQPVALLIFARKRGADLGGQPVQPEWHKSEQIECCQKTAPMGVDAETSEAFRWLQMRL